jgi:hypothetical protein
VRPPARFRASDGQGGLRLLVNHLQAFHVNGNGGSQAVDPASVAFPGGPPIPGKGFRGHAVNSHTVNGWGVSVDALIQSFQASITTETS